MGRVLQQRFHNVWLAATVSGGNLRNPRLSADKDVHVSANRLFPLSEVLQFVLPVPANMILVLVFDPILPLLLF